MFASPIKRNRVDSHSKNIQQLSKKEYQGFGGRPSQTRPLSHSKSPKRPKRISPISINVFNEGSTTQSHLQLNPMDNGSRGSRESKKHHPVARNSVSRSRPGIGSRKGSFDTNRMGYVPQYEESSEDENDTEDDYTGTEEGEYGEDSIQNRWIVDSRKSSK